MPIQSVDKLVSEFKAIIPVLSALAEKDQIQSCNIVIVKTDGTTQPFRFMRDEAVGYFLTALGALEVEKMYIADLVIQMEGI
jgi:hypothetical protein